MSQPDPIPNALPSMHDLVKDDLNTFVAKIADKIAVRDALEQRKQKGLETYGTPLQPHNGRDALQDLFEELLDAAVYARQACFERPHDAGIEHVYRQTVWLCLNTAQVMR